MTIALLAAKPGGVLHCLILVVVEEFFLSLALFFTCGLIWSLAMPAWLERLLEKVAKRLAIALAIFAVSLSILAGWALAFG
jgi:hypothetical protein